MLARLQRAEMESGEGGGPTVTEQDIANIVAQWTGIPIEKVGWAQDLVPEATSHSCNAPRQAASPSLSCVPLAAPGHLTKLFVAP